ncbi:putative chromatin assembly factor 1 subunit A [Aspergillus alliaceus]|uniref:putative chromatin assembly factor 1 subunit A n=1 Tax=Petromyces alliaceus TaxID=209559 RepID=UPI0012A4DF14|nr:chromatin assembly factor 1 subunit A-domain-containing protein [Aspergillus alliaceus]KAB8234685.1 chromatin assembly factor 1 subunit A-domain-containing protein [Aspergillus alliaceus]
MDVSMDTSPSALSPLSQSQPQPQSTTASYPTTPTASRKRSIQDIDAQTTVHTDTIKSPTYTDKENQENADPLIKSSTRVSPAMEMSHVVIRSGDLSVGSKTGDEAPVQNTKEATLGESVVNTIPSSESTIAVSMSNSSRGDAPFTKKRKLSSASKEAKQQEKEARLQEKEAKLQEKEAKERQKLEEKAKKEEEKRVKEEEKKKREADREEERRRKEDKRRAKEEERAAKEEEKRKKEVAKEEERRKKEEEKLKKDRAQPKLNAFFAKPKPSAPSSVSAITGSPKKSGGDGTANESSYEAGPSDYQRAFPEFFLQSHTKVAPPHRFERDSEALRLMREKVDACLKSPNSSEESLAFRPSDIFSMMPYKRRRGRLPASVREILLQMQTLSDQAGSSEAVQRQQGLLKKIRMKSLKFGEDVRPPYQGTYSKSLPESSAYKMMRNPFYRGLPETNYDYDSEVEWDEPEEGEELDSEEEEEMSEDGDDDMDGFLDDEDDQLVDGKRRLIVGDLEPVCTGIQWHDGRGDPKLKAYKIETISDTVSLPIDPFSTAYWQKPKTSEPAQTSGAGRSTLHSFLSNPSSGSASTQDGSALPLLGSGKAKRTFPAEQLTEFKQVVDGSDLSKLGLIEILKKRFPKVSKDVLKDTLNSVAIRVGQKEAEKKWVCK